MVRGLGHCNQTDGALPPVHLSRHARLSTSPPPSAPPLTPGHSHSAETLRLTSEGYFCGRQWDVETLRSCHGARLNSMRARGAAILRLGRSREAHRARWQHPAVVTVTKKSTKSSEKRLSMTSHQERGQGPLPMGRKRPQRPRQAACSRDHVIITMMVEQPRCPKRKNERPAVTLHGSSGVYTRPRAPSGNVQDALRATMERPNACSRSMVSTTSRMPGGAIQSPSRDRCRRRQAQARRQYQQAPRVGRHGHKQARREAPRGALAGMKSM